LDDHDNDRIRVIMASAETYVIENATRTLISETKLYMQRPVARNGQRVRVVSIPNISALEPMRGGARLRR
jgi:hypothetical protein